MEKLFKIILFLAIMLFNSTNAVACIRQIEDVSTANVKANVFQKSVYKPTFKERVSNQFLKKAKLDQNDWEDTRELEPAAVLGFLLSLSSGLAIATGSAVFFIALISFGFILSAIALYQIGKDPKHKKGGFLAILGLIPGFMLVILLVRHFNFHIK
jgi:hypothetical protein